MNLAEAAAAARALTARAEADLASECARAAAKEYLAALFVTTPVRSGDLRGTEKINAITGGGAVAVADVGPDIIYDRIQNDGGTIRAKNHPVLGNPEAGWFGKQVTIKGQHYMEKAAEEASGPIQASCRAHLAEFLTLE